MGEDLFWAIMGGGGASFRVILAYKVKLIRVPETINIFKIGRTIEQNALDIFLHWQDVVTNKLPHELFIRLIMNVVNSTVIGKKTTNVTFWALLLGESQRLLSIMNESLPLLGAQQSDCRELSWAESILFYIDFLLGTPVDALLSRIAQSIYITHLKSKLDYVKTPISRDGLQSIWNKMIERDSYGGRMVEILESKIPLPHKARNLYKIQYARNWNQEGNKVVEHYLDLTRELYAYMTPFVSKNPREAFLNCRDLDLGINYQGKKSYFKGMKYGIKYFKNNFYWLLASVWGTLVHLDGATSAKKWFDVACVLISTKFPRAILGIIPVLANGSGFLVNIFDEASGETIFSEGVDWDKASGLYVMGKIVHSAYNGVRGGYFTVSSSSSENRGSGRLELPGYYSSTNTVEGSNSLNDNDDWHYN
ncbi:hypothetical protein Ancab_021649 [Ancistrocladus abbreviatus]